MAKARKRPGRIRKEVWPLSSDAIASGIKHLLSEFELPGWREDEWGAHYVRGYVGSVACAAGMSRASVFNRIRVSEAVFSKHYSRPPVPAVMLRLAKRAKKNWDLSEIPFV